MLPQPWRMIVNAIPLKFLAYYPVAIFLGKQTGYELAGNLCLQFSWIVLLAGVSRVLYWRGVRRYSGFGG
jgi:ABC-2 type transport system permease protein